MFIKKKTGSDLNSWKNFPPLPKHTKSRHNTNKNAVTNN